MTPWSRILLALIVVGCLLMLAGTPLPLLESDSAFWGAIAKRVLASGEWLTLKHPWQPGVVVDRSPLTIWAMAVSFHIGGYTESALRLWHVLMTIALVLLTYKIARLAAGREEALLAALLMATFIQTFAMSGRPQQDVPLTLFLALGFYAYLGHRNDGKTLAAAWAGLWVALAVLTKGIVALAAFVPVIAADRLTAWRQTQTAAHWRWTQVGVGVVVFVAVAAPWFIAGAIRQGMPFVDTVFLHGSLGVGRFVRPFLTSPIPYWQVVLAYVPMLAAGLLPWTGLLPGAVREGWRGLRAGPPPIRLCALWAGVYFLLVSLAPGDKVWRYLYPCYPPLAVLAARWLTGAIGDARRLRGAAGILLVVSVPAILAVIWLEIVRGPEVREFLWMIVPPLAALFLAILAFVRITLWGRGREGVAALAVGAMLAYGIAHWMILTHWERLWPWQTVAAIVNRQYRPGDRVLGRGWTALTFASFWLDAPVEEVTDDAALMQAWKAVRVFVLLSPDDYARLGDRLGATVLVRMPVGWVLATNR